MAQAVANAMNASLLLQKNKLLEYTQIFFLLIGVSGAQLYGFGPYNTEAVFQQWGDDFNFYDDSIDLVYTVTSSFNGYTQYQAGVADFFLLDVGLAQVYLNLGILQVPTFGTGISFFAI